MKYLCLFAVIFAISSHLCAQDLESDILGLWKINKNTRADGSVDDKIGKIYFINYKFSASGIGECIGIDNGKESKVEISYKIVKNNLTINSPGKEGFECECSIQGGTMIWIGPDKCNVELTKNKNDANK